MNDNERLDFVLSNGAWVTYDSGKCRFWDRFSGEREGVVRTSKLFKSRKEIDLAIKESRRSKS